MKEAPLHGYGLRKGTVWRIAIYEASTRVQAVRCHNESGR